MHAAAAGLGVMGMCIPLGIAVLVIAGLWKVFTKAGKPGWAAIIPFYNLFIMLQIAEKPIWWIAVYACCMIPFVNFIAGIAALVLNILIGIAIANKFGKGTGFGVGLGLLAPIFYPILGFSDAKYQGGSTTPTPPAPPAAPAA